MASSSARLLVLVQQRQQRLVRRLDRRPRLDSDVWVAEQAEQQRRQLGPAERECEGRLAVLREGGEQRGGLLDGEQLRRRGEAAAEGGHARALRARDGAEVRNHGLQHGGEERRWQQRHHVGDQLLPLFAAEQLGRDRAPLGRRRALRPSGRAQPAKEALEQHAALLLPRRGAHGCRRGVHAQPDERLPRGGNLAAGVPAAGGEERGRARAVRRCARLVGRERAVRRVGRAAHLDERLGRGDLCGDRAGGDVAGAERGANLLVG